MILVVNAGSSSLKLALFDGDLSTALSGTVAEIGGRSTLKLGKAIEKAQVTDHHAAMALLLDWIAAAGYPLDTLSAAGHRIVHGGANLTAPTALTKAVVAEIKANIALAPLHIPANLAGISAIRALAPKLLQFACFDTAFHATNSAVATTYAIPETERAKGIRRYGFHGLSYAGMVAHFGDALPERLLALHLGNGASLCAIKAGKSVATTAGYSPLSGLVMGTRAGPLDGMAVLRMAKDHGIEATAALLNKHSGLKALAGTNDMARLLARNDAQARFALDHFCYWVARQAGSVIMAMGGVDAVAFTGGIGENAAAVRDRIMRHLSWIGNLPVHIVPADEERQIARHVAALLVKRA